MGMMMAALGLPMPKLIMVMPSAWAEIMLASRPKMGATSTTFDISSFMPMIAGLGGGDYLFTITATDQLGQKASRTLTVRNLND